MENGYGLGDPPLQSEVGIATAGELRRPNCVALPRSTLGSSTKSRRCFKALADGTALVN